MKKHYRLLLFNQNKTEKKIAFCWIVVAVIRDRFILHWLLQLIGQDYFGFVHAKHTHTPLDIN